MGDLEVVGRVALDHAADVERDRVVAGRSYAHLRIDWRSRAVGIVEDIDFAVSAEISDPPNLDPGIRGSLAPRAHP
jgi:hypothetical protein